MDSDGLPIVGSGIDYTKVGAIHQKRTLAFLNHFITHTVRFLNRFSGVCDDKLANLSLRIQRLETTISNLEAKLSSIPGLENVTVPTASTATPATPVQNPEPENSHTDKPAEETADKEAPPAPAIEEETPVMTVLQDPAYAKYFKMVQMGVPAPALRMKMESEGLNPDLLETPNAPSPNASAASARPTGTMANDDDDDDDALTDSSDDSSGFSD